MVGWKSNLWTPGEQYVTMVSVKMKPTQYAQWLASRKKRYLFLYWISNTYSWISIKNSINGWVHCLREWSIFVSMLFRNKCAWNPLKDMHTYNYIYIIFLPAYNLLKQHYIGIKAWKSNQMLLFIILSFDPEKSI
jgi:hypothetical protein